MPGLRTEITEIVTGLGMLPLPSLGDAVASRPAAMRHVETSHWLRLADTLDDPAFADDARRSWENGRAFLHARDGLRDRMPLAVEWKGPHHPPSYDFLPADLRIDHVYLVSCKYLSKVLANPSPAHLFRRALADRGARSEADWFSEVAGDAYRAFYAEVRDELAADVTLPADVAALSQLDRDRIQQRCARVWPGDLEGAYASFSAAVSAASAAVWSGAVPTLAAREQLLWRMLRFNPAPYFILGSAGASSLRLRVATPWDWRQRYTLRDFDIAAQAGAQPRVAWRADVLDRVHTRVTAVEGHVEIRWSHGRFCGSPEAKLYLDSPHDAVPGYFPLE